MSMLGLSQYDLNEHDVRDDDIGSSIPFSPNGPPHYQRIRSKPDYCSKAAVIIIVCTLLVITLSLLQRLNIMSSQLASANQLYASVAVTEIENSKPPDVRRPQMLVVCSHEGTRADMFALASHFQFQAQWLNLEDLTQRWADFRQEQDHLLRSHDISALCSAYDIIAVTDNIWGGWLFLQIEEQCAKKLLLVATNRYDHYLLVDEDRGIDFPRHWHDILSQKLRDNNWRYPVMVQNNPFESYYMKHHGLDLFPTEEHQAAVPPPPKDLVPVIRSLGASPYPFDPNAEQETNPHRCLYFINTWHRTGGESVEKLAQQQGLKARCHVIESSYGGPTYFHKQNTAFWYMPYQVSLMKQSELVIAGVVTLVPSLEFWIEIESSVREITHEFHFVTSAINTLITDEQMTLAQSAEILDIWSSAFAPCTVEFNSWQELDNLIDSQSWRSKSPECREYREYYLNAQLGLWHQLFDDRFPQIPRPPVTKAERDAVKQLYQVDL